MSSIPKASDEKYCTECGEIIKARAEICPKCGVRQFPPPFGGGLGQTAPNGKNRLAAILFAFFLGVIGAHKFYLGQTGWGILYLAFFWTGIPAVVGIIEAILLLVMSEEDFIAKYGNL
ncbi:MAG: NINE protein [Deltaproteobacteria bacterium]|nr:NINE protein [Deltaproteobacteria bacterium]